MLLKPSHRRHSRAVMSGPSEDQPHQLASNSIRSLDSLTPDVSPSSSSTSTPLRSVMTPDLRISRRHSAMPDLWPTFSVHAALHQTRIPLHAYIHLSERLEPYKRNLKPDPKTKVIFGGTIDLAALRTVDELDYKPANRNLAIRQTLSHYFSNYLPSVVTSNLHSLRPSRPSPFPSSSRSSTSPSSLSSESAPSQRTLSTQPTHSVASSDSASLSANFVTGIPIPEAFHQLTPAPATPALKPKKSQKLEGFKNLRGNVVILGGFRGSVLESDRGGKTRKVLWPNIQEAILKREDDPDLAMLLSADEAFGGMPWKEGETRQADLSNGARSGPMLDRITLSPGLPPVLDLGYSLRRRLERHNKRRQKFPAADRLRIQDWGYDFRDDLEETSDRLIKFLTELKASSPDGEGATVFAHSMGGLVTLGAMSKAADLSIFKQLVFLGTPFRGVPGILAPMRYGDVFIRQVNLVNPFTSSSWPSSFYLLPQTPTFITPDGKSINLDLSKIKTWDEFGLSPLAAGVTEACEQGRTRPAARRPSVVMPEAVSLRLQDSLGMAPASCTTGKPRVEHERTKSPHALHPSNATPSMIRAHFERCHRRAAVFHARLMNSHDPQRRYPPMVIVAANRVQTPKGSIISQPTPEKFLEEGYKSLVFDWGDGVVTWDSAVRIPGGWGAEVVKIVESRFGHMTLMADHGSIDEALRACQAKLR